MESSILYFPYIHLPNNKWLYRSLMYWDQIGTIVPVTYEIRANTLTDELVRLKLAKLIHPEEVIYKRRNFVKSFMEYIDDDDYPIKPGAISKGVPTTRIHMSKMLDIARELEERGLSRRTRGPWFNVEQNTANKFMAYLAGIVGGVKNMTPATDNPKNLSAFITFATDSEMLDVRLEPDRIEVLDKILPAPSRKPDMKKLVAFKEKHRDELVRFRNHIEAFLPYLQDSTSQDVKDRKTANFKREVEEEVARLRALIQENRLSRPDLGSIMSLSSTSFGTAGAILATGPGALMGAIAAALGLVGGVYSTYKKIKTAKEQVRQSFAAYALQYNF